MSISTNNDIEGIVSRLEAIEQTIANYELYVWIVGGVFVVLAFFAYRKYVNEIRGKIEEKINTYVEKETERWLPRVLKEARENAESHILKLARMLALMTQKLYDEALTDFGWTGRVSDLRNESPTMRRTIIECLFGAKSNKQANREAAWDAVKELVTDDESIETVRLYLQLSIACKKYEDGMRFYGEKKEQILEDVDSAIKVATIHRKLRKLDQAREIVDKLKASDDFGALVAIAVLERDQGNFDEVHDILYPHLKKVLSGDPEDLPEGWNRLINTYIANCIDRSRPNDAIEAGKRLARDSMRPIELFTVGRLIVSLSDDDDKENLKKVFLRKIEDLPDSDATIRCKALEKQLKGNIDGAIEIIESAISKLESREDGQMSTDQYFLSCALAELKIEKGISSEAIDIGIAAAQKKVNGEAKYILARAYADEGEPKDAARWLKQALDESPKWAEKARDDDLLRRHDEVNEVLADIAQKKNNP